VYAKNDLLKHQVNKFDLETGAHSNFKSVDKKIKYGIKVGALLDKKRGSDSKK